MIPFMECLLILSLTSFGHVVGDDPGVLVEDGGQQFSFSHISRHYLHWYCLKGHVEANAVLDSMDKVKTVFCSAE